MAAGYRRVVEAHVRREAPADPRPLAREWDDPRVVALDEAEVLAGGRCLHLRGLEQRVVLARLGARERAAVAHRLLAHLLRVGFAGEGSGHHSSPSVTEEGYASKVISSTFGARVERVKRRQREYVTALAATKRSGANERAGGGELPFDDLLLPCSELLPSHLR